MTGLYSFRKIHIIHFVLGLLLFFCLFTETEYTLYAQSEGNFPVVFYNLSSEHQLSQSTVNAILEDHTGFMWFGTEDGLNRYDGYRIKVYKQQYGMDGSLSNSAIWTLFEDSEGTLWIGTFNGLNFYDSRNDRFISFFHEHNNPHSLSHNYIHTIMEDTRHQMWFGTSDGLNLLDKKDSTFLHYNHEPDHPRTSLISNVILAMLTDHLGKIWVGTKGGLNVFNEMNNTFSGYRIQNGGVLHDVTALMEDKAGRLWVGTHTGDLYIFNRQTETFRQVLNAPGSKIEKSKIKTLAEAPDGTIWVCTLTSLYSLNPDTKKATLYLHDPMDTRSLSNNSIRTIYMGENGFIWIGTSNAGVSVIKPPLNRFHHIRKRYNQRVTLSSKQIRSFGEDKNGMILIGQDKGLSFFSPSAYSFRHQNPALEKMLEDKSVNAINVSKDNTYWIGTRTSGLLKYNPGNKAWKWFVRDYTQPLNSTTISGNNIISLLEDHAGNIWIGTNGYGLNKYNPHTGIFTHYVHNPDSEGSLSHNRIYAILEDRKHHIWVGTAGGGINKFDPGTNQFVHYASIRSDTGTFYFNYILSLHEGPNNNIWAGTFGSGLIGLNYETGRISEFTRKNGLPDNVIYGILEDKKGRLWLSQNEGITVFNPNNQEIINYDKRDGLQENEFNSGAFFQTSGGLFLFGGNNGFNIFSPDSIRKSMKVPRVVFTGLRISNHEVQPGEKINGHIVLNESIFNARKIHLKYSDRDIYLEFAALDYTIPGKNKYKYRLLGSDNHWIDLANTNNIRFDQLPVRTTILQVVGSNHDGVWNTTGTSVTFYVTPPFYQTLAFKFIILVMFVGFAYLLYYIRTLQLKKQKEELQLLVGNKTREIVNQRDILAEKNEELERINREILAERDKTKALVRTVEEANQTKLQFFTNISHEFRTPLTLILNMIEKFNNEPNGYTSGERKNDYKLIEKNAQKLLKLIDRLMLFRKYSTHQAGLKISENNLVQFLKNQAMLFSGYAEKKKITFRFESRSEQLPVWFDPEQMEEVISNLLSNAFKYTAEQGVIKVSAGEASDAKVRELVFSRVKHPDQYIYFMVEDTGIGIPQDKLDKVFERFYQINDAKNETGTGMGIGLHISKKIILLHRGQIFVDSEPGRGSRFVVLLKKGKDHLSGEYEFRQETYTSDKRFMPDVDPEGSGKLLRSDQKLRVEALSRKNMPEILIVEDNKDLRNFLVKGLEEDYNILEAGTGEEALRIIENDNPEVIICDVLLPGKLNGFDIVEQVKSNLNTSHIPVIVLTALTSKDQKILGLEKGADVYITKPFSLRELIAHVKSLIQLRESLKKKFRDYTFWTERELEINDQDESFIQKIIRIVETNISDPSFDVNTLCETVSMSQTRLYRKLKALTGMTIKEFIQGLRLRKAAILLLNSEDKNISEIAYEVGFNDPNYFGKVFKTHYGMSPSEYIKNGGS